jgi:integrase
MARRVKDKTLDSRDARQRLPVRGRPHYRAIERGLHLGYRRLKGAAGTWVVRHYAGDQSYEIERIGNADDFSDADGSAVLDFWQAQTKARELMAKRAGPAGKGNAALTVADALDDYIGFLESNRKSAGDARYRDQALIRPKLGSIKIGDLTADQIRKWHVDLAKAPARLRTRQGEKQNHRPLGTDDEAKRRRRATANRTLTVLKAALNRAWREGRVASNTEWARVEPFENVDAARVRYLTVAEAKRLINACDADFRKLVEAGLQTGARYSELAALRVHDFNPDSGTVAIRQSKAGKARHVVLTDEGVSFFKQLCAGQAGSELMLLKLEGRKKEGEERSLGPWRKSHQKRPMAAACKHAKIKPPISFHGLRHTWASLAVMNGTPLLVVAKNLGHSDTRMVEKHYGHLAPSYIADAIRAGAPRFGFKPDRKVTPLHT